MVKGSITPLAPENSVTRNVSVSVTDGTDPLGNVDIILEDAEENQYTGRTGSAGGCTIRNVPEGTYNFVASATGYVDYTGTLTVSEQSHTLDIILTASATPVTATTYNFISYDSAEGTNEWGQGSVETTGTINNGFTEVEVLSNTTDESFIGQKFYITSDAKTDGTIYPLYTDAGETLAGIYVSITQN